MHPWVGARGFHPLLVSLLALTTLVSAPAFSLERERVERREESESGLEHESEDWEADGRSESSDEDDSLPAPSVAAEQLRAGQRVIVRWSPIGPEVEEFELILSLDGGRTWSLRISPELHRDQHRYEWDVPNLGAEHARIRIRARIDQHEVWGPEGAPFRMVPSTNRPKERWLFWETWRWDQGGTEGIAEHGMTARLPSLRAGTASTPLESPVRLLVPSRIQSGRTQGRTGFRVACVVAPSSDASRERRLPMRE